MNRLSAQHGGIILQLILVKLVLVCAFVVAFFFFASQIYQPTSGAEVGDNANSNSTGSGPVDDPTDFGTGFLVCVNLPGVVAPKTPALDRRVARKLEAVRADLNAQGIAPLRFTYGFRSTAEQVAVDPGSNYKAAPGTSPHEAGRAVDVAGMSVRADRGYIVATFVRHGWRWLGRGDPPHFEVAAESVGEPDRIAMIRKAQADFNRGNPLGCHRGRRGMNALPSGGGPSNRLQRINSLYG